jgi:hypothetical protein
MVGTRWIRGLGAALLAAAALLPGCTAHSDRIQAYRVAWGAGDFPAAEQAIDGLLLDEGGIPESAREEVLRSHGTDARLDAAKGNTYLLLLEKAMVRLARGDAQRSVEVLLKARTALDAQLEKSFGKDLKAFFGGGIVDDEAMDYAGADYEHILVRVLLTITDLLKGGEDAYAYACQVSETQDRIIESPYGDAAKKFEPRKQYQRVAAGSYFRGIVKEENLESSEAALAFEEGLRWAGGAAPAGKKGGAADPDAAPLASATKAAATGASGILQEALERARAGTYAPAAHGVLHVVYLAGQGPHLETTHADPTSDAIQLATIGIAFASGSPTQLGQAAVPVPRVVVTSWGIPPVPIHVDGAAAPSGRTGTLLDVNVVAKQQLEANMPGIVARALVRRAVKGVGAEAARQASGGGLFGDLIGIATAAALTAGERAETRNWVSLPAQFQVARVPLPAGERRVSFGTGIEARIRIAQGRDSWCVLLRPNLALPGTILVDVHSRVAEVPPPAVVPPPEAGPSVPKPAGSGKP